MEDSFDVEILSFHKKIWGEFNLVGRNEVLSSFIHPKVVSNLCEFLSSAEHRRYFKEYDLSLEADHYCTIIIALN